MFPFDDVIMCKWEPLLPHSEQLPNASLTAYANANASLTTHQRFANRSIMLGLHRTPEGLGTDLRPKNGQTRGYSGVGR